MFLYSFLLNDRITTAIFIFFFYKNGFLLEGNLTTNKPRQYEISWMQKEFERKQTKWMKFKHCFLLCKQKYDVSLANKTFFQQKKKGTWTMQTILNLSMYHCFNLQNNVTKEISFNQWSPTVNCVILTKNLHMPCRYSHFFFLVGFYFVWCLHHQHQVQACWKWLNIIIFDDSNIFFMCSLTFCFISFSDFICFFLASDDHSSTPIRSGGEAEDEITNKHIATKEFVSTYTKLSTFFNINFKCN